MEYDEAIRKIVAENEAKEKKRKELRYQEIERLALTLIRDTSQWNDALSKAHSIIYELEKRPLALD